MYLSESAASRSEVRARPRGARRLALRLSPLLSTEQRSAIEQEAEARGYADGMARAADQLQAAIDTISNLPQAYVEALPSTRSELATGIAELSLAIAGAILGEAVRLDGSTLCRAVGEALERADVRGRLIVSVAPAAVEPLRATWPADKTGVEVVFVGDAELPAGGCRVRFDSGMIDAGLESQLANIAAALRATARSGQ